MLWVIILNKQRQKLYEKDMVAVIYYSGLRTTEYEHQRPVFEPISRQSTPESFVIFLWLSICADLKKGSFLSQDSYQMSTNNGQKTEWCGTKYQHNNDQQTWRFTIKSTGRDWYKIVCEKSPVQIIIHKPNGQKFVYNLYMV